MDCSEPVDDYCDVRQVEYDQFPQDIPRFIDNLDQFFIVLEVEKTVPLSYDNDEEDHRDEFVKVESTNSLTFWAPCPRSDKDNLSKETISAMLSTAGVPLHKHEYMVDQISSRADQIANQESNKGSKILAMVVSVSIVACFCMFGETNDDCRDEKKN